jgi:hypothetical protein
MSREVDPTRKNYTYFNNHHNSLNEPCTAALAGCRTCTDLWRCFVKQKTPAEYYALPILTNGAGMPHVYLNSGISYGFLEPGYFIRGYKPHANKEMLLKFSLDSPITIGADTKRYSFRNAGAVDEIQMDDYFRSTPAGWIRTSNMTEEELDLKRWDLIGKWMMDCSTLHDICKARRRMMTSCLLA